MREKTICSLATGSRQGGPQPPVSIRGQIPGFNRRWEAEDVGAQPSAQVGQDFELGLRMNPACCSEMISGFCHLSADTFWDISGWG